jgi:hypothetical protein
MEICFAMTKKYPDWYPMKKRFYGPTRGVVSATRRRSNHSVSLIGELSEKNGKLFLGSEVSPNGGTFVFCISDRFGFLKRRDEGLKIVL